MITHEYRQFLEFIKSRVTSEEILSQAVREIEKVIGLCDDDFGIPAEPLPQASLIPAGFLF